MITRALFLGLLFLGLAAITRQEGCILSSFIFLAAALVMQHVNDKFKKYETNQTHSNGVQEDKP